MISVVMAAYNGEKYIAEQIESIMCQLGDDDELVISDDNPQGKTFNVVSTLMSGDNRIRYIRGKGEGVIKNFENAISNAKGDYIFLSDQDDVWQEGKVEAVMKAFAEGADVVMHDATIADADLVPVGETAFGVNHAKTGIIRNILKNSYQGSCMAFKATLCKYILPFPNKLPMHDQWIGIMGEKHGVVRLINHSYILYRRHSDNVSGNGSSLKQKIMWRMDIIGCLFRK